MFILDTDAMSVWLDPRDTLRGHLERRYANPSSPRRITTIVGFQETVRGWLAKINRVRKADEIVREHANLLRDQMGYCSFEVLPFTRSAQDCFEEFRRQRVRIPTMDLRIACIAIVHNAKLLTRNLRDFRQVPGLVFEDWSR